MKKRVLKYLHIILMILAFFGSAQAEDLEKAIKKTGARLLKTKKSRIPMIKKRYTELNTKERNVTFYILQQQLKKFMSKWSNTDSNFIPCRQNGM